MKYSVFWVQEVAGWHEVESPESPLSCRLLPLSPLLCFRNRRAQRVSIFQMTSVVAIVGAQIRQNLDIPSFLSCYGLIECFATKTYICFNQFWLFTFSSWLLQPTAGVQNDLLPIGAWTGALLITFVFSASPNRKELHRMRDKKENKLTLT